MPQVNKLNPRVTIWSRCREWNQTKLRRDFELSMLDEDDDEGTARIIDLADATMDDIEAALIEQARTMTSVDDAQALLGIALAIFREDGFDPDGRVQALIKAVRYGLNGVRNACNRAAEAA